MIKPEIVQSHKKMPDVMIIKQRFWQFERLWISASSSSWFLAIIICHTPEIMRKRPLRLLNPVEISRNLSYNLWSQGFEWLLSILIISWFIFSHSISFPRLSWAPILTCLSCKLSSFLHSNYNYRFGFPGNWPFSISPKPQCLQNSQAHLLLLVR